MKTRDGEPDRGEDTVDKLTASALADRMQALADFQATLPNPDISRLLQMRRNINRLRDSNCPLRYMRPFLRELSRRIGLAESAIRRAQSRAVAS